MLLILSSILMVAVIAAMLLWHANETDSGTSAVFGVLLAVLAGSSALIYSVAAYNWFAADYKVQIINREYGTNYTQAEVFWASDAIETIQQLNRKRYEVNGDLFRDK